MDLYEYDEAIRSREIRLIAGVDEAGRGPLAGPVVAAAVILPADIRIVGVRDSKKVPEKERGSLFLEIKTYARAIGVGIVDSDEIDRINILQATKLAMHKAITSLGEIPDTILIDALTLPSIKINQIPIIKGDAKSACIAAASLIAKVTRDRLMQEYHALYPQYGFDRHKGYGTSAHIAKIKEYGPCPIHRKTFQKVMSQSLPLDMYPADVH